MEKKITNSFNCQSSINNMSLKIDIWFSLPWQGRLAITRRYYGDLIEFGL